MVSRVHSRMDATALGNFSLGLSHVGVAHSNDVKAAIHALTSLLSELLPASATLDLSIERLNSRKFSPRKDYQVNRLVSGPLQLPTDTHLVLDETAMQAGKLNDHGCRNLRALQQVVLDQTVTYDFMYSTSDWPIDAPAVVVSTGPPMIKCKLQLPLQCTYSDGLSGPTATTAQSTLAHSFATRLPQARGLIAAAKYLPFTLSEAGSAAVEAHFVQARQQDKDISAEHLHAWITHARLLAVSHGETTLTDARWNEARAMEAVRLQRVKQVTPKKGGPPPSGFGIPSAPTNGGPKRTVAPHPDSA